MSGMCFVYGKEHLSRLLNANENDSPGNETDILLPDYEKFSKQLYACNTVNQSFTETNLGKVA